MANKGTNNTARPLAHYDSDGTETLLLENRRPIRIRSADWPQVAMGESHIGRAYCVVMVRWHKDNNRHLIVTGVYTTNLDRRGELNQYTANEHSYDGVDYIDEMFASIQRRLVAKARVYYSLVIPDACERALNAMPPEDIE